MSKLFSDLSYLFLASFLILSSWSTQALEDNFTPPLSRGKGIFFIEMGSSYYDTDKNYTQFGKVQPILSLTEEYFFRYASAEFGLGYSLSKWFEVRAFTTGFWFVQSRGNEVNLHSGFQVKRGGAAFHTPQMVGSNFGFIPEFSISAPFFQLNKNSNTPITDDGALHFTPAIWFYGVIGQVFFPFTYVGFKYRNQSLSSFLQWKTGAMLQADIVEIGAYTYGFWPVIRDKSSRKLGDRAQLLKRTNADSLKFFSSNPALIGFAGWIAWRFPYVTLRFSGDIDINGMNHAKGYTFLASLLLEFVRRKKNPSMEDMFKEPQELLPESSEKEMESAFENLEKDTIVREEVQQALEETEKLEEEKLEEEN